MVNSVNSERETFGQMIRRLRKWRRWTQTRLAEEATLDQSTISAIELDRGQPTATSVTRLAGVFDADPHHWAQLAGLLPLPAEVVPPAVPPEEPTGDGPYDVRRIVAFVEDFPGEKFQRNLAEDAEYMSPEEYEEYCVNIWRMWAGNGDLAHGLARAMRPRPRRPTDEPATKG